MRFGVIALPGAVGVDDVLRAIELLGAAGSGRVIAGDERELGDVDAAVVLGDPSKVAAAPVLDAVERFAADGHPVLGVAGGFGVLCSAGLLDGAVERVVAGASERAVHCLVEGRPTPFTAAIPAGRHMAIGSLAPDLRYVCTDTARLLGEGRVVLRFCSFDGEVCAEADPVGSVDNIAGVCNTTANVVGLLPGVNRSLLESVLAHHAGTPARVGG